LYDSLLAQSSDDFCWLIIDDGSTDGTRELVEGWIAQNRIAIEYLWQPNRGMHGAHNAAYRLIDTELNVCIDSDDCLTSRAVELIVGTWRRRGSEQLAGIIGLDATMRGEVIGTLFDTPSTTLYGFYKRGGRGDKKLVYRTDIIKSVPEYPLFEGEKYVGLGYKYLLVDLKYELLTLNEPLCLVDYRPDGSSMNMYRQYFRNPRGFSFIRREAMVYHPSRRRRYFEAVHYVAESIIGRDGGFVASSPRKVLTLLALPAGVLLWGYLSLQYRRNKAMSI
jgi:glycosyltransferase involved in cell wall biosynthesis